MSKRGWFILEFMKLGKEQLSKSLTAIKLYLELKSIAEFKRVDLIIKMLW